MSPCRPAEDRDRDARLLPVGAEAEPVPDADRVDDDDLVAVPEQLLDELPGAVGLPGALAREERERLGHRVEGQTKATQSRVRGTALLRMACGGPPVCPTRVPFPRSAG
jgi:hypothetical protein